MDGQSGFEAEVRGRIERLEETVAALAGKIDNLSPSGAQDRARRAPSNDRDDPRGSLSSRTADPGSHAKPGAPAPRGFAESAKSRGADWWLARAGAALTLLALILLYQYAVGHGWITPVVRVMAGAAVGAALMHWGRKLQPAAGDAAFPVALRELMMGSALAAWYVTAYAAAVLYHLISVPTARFIYLVLSIIGGLIALDERRSLLAIVAIGTGFATPALLFTYTGSIPAYTVFLAVLGSLSIYLYLMRGWQSILWIAFFSMALSIEVATSRTLLVTDSVSMTVLILAMAFAFPWAVAMRRTLVASGSERYQEPIRSTLAQNWLREAAHFLKSLSPHAGAADSLSVWVITVLAPLIGIALFTQAWHLGAYPGGALAIIAAAVASRRFLSSAGSDPEVTDVFCAAAVLWSLAGVVAIGRSLAHASGIDEAAVPLGAMALYSIAIAASLSPPRFVTALAVGRLLAGFAIAAAFFRELSALGDRGTQQLSITAAFTIAEVLSIAAALAAAREMSRHAAWRGAIAPLCLAGYASFLLVDARVLASFWPPLVTATFAIAGTALLLLSRSGDKKLMRGAGGATIALVIGRLLFVDLVGVDTIWRVLLFLGCGALFLFTSYQIQKSAKEPPPNPA